MFYEGLIRIAILSSAAPFLTIFANLDSFVSFLLMQEVPTGKGEGDEREDEIKAHQPIQQPSHNPLGDNRNGSLTDLEDDRRDAPYYRIPNGDSLDHDSDYDRDA